MSKNKIITKFSITLSFIAIVFISFIILAKSRVNDYEEKIIAELDTSSNIESLNIQKNGYQNVFSFDGFIENDELLNIYSTLEQNSDIERLEASIDFPAFLSIRKASIFVDMQVSEEIGSEHIVSGRIYDDASVNHEIVIGSELSSKYDIPHNSIVALVVKDIDDVYSVTNMYVSGISHFEDDSEKNNMGYISQNKFKALMGITEDYPFTQKIDIIVHPEAAVSDVSDYLKENINMSLFNLEESMIRKNIFDEEMVKQSIKPTSKIFMLAILLTLCSIARLVLFRIKIKE